MFRNLFYRTLELLREGIKLLFVIDGRAPDLKRQAMLDRQKQQFGSTSRTVNLDRPMLTFAVNECVKLFDCLGVRYIQSPGEAEAMCAYLNVQGVVDGCITQDNDYFCYGGRTLYRNLRKENKLYIVDIYESAKIQSALELNQRDLVSLALLLGSDLDQQGIKSVGEVKGMKLVHELKSRNIDVLDRLLGWRNNEELDSLKGQMKIQPKHDDHCKKCKHLGRINIHQKDGCAVCKCKTDCKESCDILCGCDWCKHQELVTKHKMEIDIREKLLDSKLRDVKIKKIVTEYLCFKPDTNISSGDVEQRPLDVPALVAYMKTKFNWEKPKVFESIVPLVIVMQLRNGGQSVDRLYEPISIIRECRENHVVCYEVLWKKTAKNLWATTDEHEMKVEKNLFTNMYPLCVKKYEEARNAKKKVTGKKRKLDFNKGQTKLDGFFKTMKKSPNAAGTSNEQK